MDLLRQAPIGTVLRVVSKNRILPYEEQKPGYEHPGRHVEVEDENAAASSSNSTLVADEDRDSSQPKASGSQGSGSEGAEGGEKGQKGQSDDNSGEGKSKDAGDAEKGGKQEKPKKKVHDPTYVHWRGDDDPDSPLNWTTGKKLYVTTLLGLYTAVVYIASAIVTNTAGIQYLSEQFGNPKQSEITLGLTLFVLGYSLAPLVLTPLTALPRYGRQFPFLISFFFYIAFLIGSAAVRNLAGYLVLRFLCGLAGSPAISTVGVSLSEIWGPIMAPRAIAIWGSFATAGPVMGPLIGAAAAVRWNTWRAPLYVLACVAAFTIVLMFLTLPETSPDAILHRRMLRLRRATGDDKYETEWQKEGKDISIWGTVKTACKCIADPTILYVCAQVALVYMILYDWFETFPVAFGAQGYGFTPVEEGLAYLFIGVGVAISVALYVVWLIYRFEPQARAGNIRPELFIEINWIAVFALPICLFFFGWTANRTPWYVPGIASMFFAPAAFGVFMSGMNYLTLAFPSVVMPIFAINAVSRGVFAAFGPLYAQPALSAIGVAWWSSLLGFVSLIMIPLPLLLTKYGMTLRKRSKYAPEE